MSRSARFGFVAVLAALVSVSATAIAQTGEECAASSEKYLALRKQGKLIEARKEVAACSADACPNVIKTDCQRRLQEIAPMIPGVVFEVKDTTGAILTNVKVSVDGVPLVDHLDGLAVPVDPGLHKFTFEAPNQPTSDRSFMIAEGDKAHRETVTLGGPATNTNTNTTNTNTTNNTNTNTGTGDIGPERQKPPEPPKTPAGQSAHGAIYIQAGIGVGGLVFLPQFGGDPQFFAGFHPDIEFGFHVTGRHDGFVIGVRQGFTYPAVSGPLGGSASGTSELRLGWDIPVKVGDNELTIAPYVVGGVGYVFDGLPGAVSPGANGASVGVVVGGGLEGKFFVAGGFYAFLRPFEVGAQCFQDVGVCAVNLVFSAGAGFAIGN